MKRANERNGNEPVPLGRPVWTDASCVHRGESPPSTDPPRPKQRDRDTLGLQPELIESRISLNVLRNLRKR